MFKYIMASQSDIRKICVTNFVNQLTGFIDDLLIIIPNNEGIMSANKYVSTLSLVNPKLLLTMWYDSVTKKYATQIKEGDLEFALNKDYTDDISHKTENDSDSSASILVLIENLKQATKTLDDDQKKTIVKYLQNITQLTQLYHQ
tara:strand:- start:78 stop:512 length:435 start_codon:yes stop_codon:yes gene_type:complete